MFSRPARALAAFTLLSAAVPAGAAQPARPPVVVELFTAQGCAACPQANALLQELAGRKDVVALTYPVDIWDYLGWPDAGAKPEFTERQRAYISRMKLREIYTPEMVIGGKKEVVGFDRAKVQALLDSQPRLRAPPVRFRSAASVEVGAGRRAGGRRRGLAGAL